MKEFFYKKIKNLLYYKNLEELVEDIDVSLMGFDSKEEVVEVMEKFYSNELGKMDIVAIELE